jgi:hypothetical protein
VKTPNNDPSAFIKLVFGSDTDLNEIESVVKQYHAMLEACEVPERTRKMIMGGTLAKMLAPSSVRFIGNLLGKVYSSKKPRLEGPNLTRTSASASDSNSSYREVNCHGFYSQWASESRRFFLVPKQ